MLSPSGSSATDSQLVAYDLNGNITSKTTKASGQALTTLTYNYSYSTTPNRLDQTTGTGGLSFAYNTNGAMTTRGANTIAYDHRGLPTGYNSVAYTIDSEGKRLKKVDGGTTTYYLRGANGDVLAEYNGAGTLGRTYVYAGSQRIAQVISGSPQYYVTDHLGSTRAVIASNGSSIGTTDYWPYGATVQQAGADTTRYKFTGYERDVESGLDYTPARPYDNAGSERFLKPDRMASKYPGISPYAYAAGNPMGFTDATGDTLTFTGNQNNNYRRVEQIANRKLGGFYTASIGDNGQLSLMQTDQQGPLSADQQAFLDVLNTAINETANITIGLVNSSEDVFVGDYDLGAIDVNDMEKLGNGPKVTTAGAFAHEVTEQTWRQISGSDDIGYDHERAVEVENAVNGHLGNGRTREDSWSSDGRHGTTPQGTAIFSGTLTLSYAKGVAVLVIERNNLKAVQQ